MCQKTSRYLLMTDLHTIEPLNPFKLFNFPLINGPGVAGAFLKPGCHTLIDLLNPNLKVIINPKPIELGS